MHFLYEAFTVLSHGCSAFTLTYQIYSDTGFLATRQQTMPLVMEKVQDSLIRWILKDEKKEK